MRSLIAVRVPGIVRIEKRHFVRFDDGLTAFPL
jgi:hypothetical protein